MSTAAADKRGPRPLKLRVHAALRWVHIYLSLFSLLIVFFFSATGLTLNHPEWVGSGAHPVEREGSVPAELVRGTVQKLELVEYLRSHYEVRGALDEFRIDESECMVSFKGPGYAADSFITRSSGALRLSVEADGNLAILNDLHKGRHTSKTWAWVIDLSAGLLIVLSLTGLGLFLYLKKLRRAGLATALVGVLITVGLMWLTLAR